jgi:hypothetical protein
MSIKIMNAVWQLSKQKGTPLLLMIAIADNANDGGEAWPGIEYLAHKIRMSERQTQRLVRDLEKTDELIVERGGGRGNAHRYFILFGKTPDEIATLRAREKKGDKMSPFPKEIPARQPRAIKGDKLSPFPEDAKAQPAEPIKGDKMTPFPTETPELKGDTQVQKGDIFGLKGDTAMSPEPINRQEPKEVVVRVQNPPPENEFSRAVDAIYQQATGSPPSQEILTRLAWQAGECDPDAQKHNQNGQAWVLAALRESVGRADDLLAYTLAILARWCQDGPQSDNRPKRPAYRPAGKKGASPHEKSTQTAPRQPLYQPDF